MSKGKCVYITNKGRITIVPLMAMGDKEQGKSIVTGLKLLLTGVNKVTAEEFAQMEDALQPRMKSTDDKKADIFVKFPVKTKAPAGSDKTVIKHSTAFKDLDADKAEKLVADTYDKKLLNEWLNEEERDSVRVAIKNRLSKFEEKRKEAKRMIDGE